MNDIPSGTLRTWGGGGVSPAQRVTSGTKKHNFATVLMSFSFPPLRPTPRRVDMGDKGENRRVSRWKLSYKSETRPPTLTEGPRGALHNNTRRLGSWHLLLTLIN